MGTEKMVALGFLHEEHKQWRLQLDFCSDEIVVFEVRLEELVQRFTGAKVLAEIEHFQNQFIRQKEVLDILRHDIGLKQQVLEKISQKSNVSMDEPSFEDQENLRNEVQIYLKIYKDLKLEYTQLLLKLL